MWRTAASFGRRFFGLFACVLLFPLLSQISIRADQAIYTDSLQNGWQDWGWATINYNNASPVHSGSKSVAVTITDNSSQAIYIAHGAFDCTPYTNITFWINGGASGGQKLLIQGHAGGTQQTITNLPTLPTNAWVQMSFSLVDLGVANRSDFDGFWIQDRIGAPQPTFYLDDITLVAGPPIPALTNIYVDALSNRHAISPLIYGVAFATSNQLSDLNSPLNRSGGNAETRYNWQLNAHNHAADWYFESLADSTNTPGAATDDHVANSKSGGADAMVTISMIGWLPKLGSNRGRLSSFSIAKYGQQADHDWQWFPDAGNGVVTNSSLPITNNDPNDASFLTNSAFQQVWVQHLTNRWGVSTNGGVRYYCMDNEHTIWHSTHRDVHPVGTTMTEIRDKIFDYAAKVKAVDPNATVVGPEEWGWSGYFYSGLDQQWSDAHGIYDPAQFPDRSTNGGWDYLPWLLDQCRQHATNTNQRLLDYFTVHYYPQSGEFSSDTSTNMQLLRNRSTRSLWDTNYVDGSWIGSVVKLIPRIKSWAATYYPGTKTGLTEYNWGADDHINGATAQADILGILGREGIDLSTRWETPDATNLTYKAMKMFRNYDGNKSGFGDTSVSASGLNPDNTSTFAAIRSADGALTLMVINKQIGIPATNTINLANFLSSGVAQRWQLTSANVITHLADLNFIGNSFTNTAPAQSITLYVIGPGAAAHLRAGAISASNTFDFWLDAQAGQRYLIQASSNFANWWPVQTNTLASNSFHVFQAASNAPVRFYRAQWFP